MTQQANHISKGTASANPPLLPIHHQPLTCARSAPNCLVRGERATECSTREGDSGRDRDLQGVGTAGGLHVPPARLSGGAHARISAASAAVSGGKGRGGWSISGPTQSACSRAFWGEAGAEGGADGGSAPAPSACGGSTAGGAPLWGALARVEALLGRLCWRGGEAGREREWATGAGG